MIIRPESRQINGTQLHDRHGGAQNNNRTYTYVLIVMICHTQQFIEDYARPIIFYKLYNSAKK